MSPKRRKVAGETADVPGQSQAATDLRSARDKPRFGDIAVLDVVPGTAPGRTLQGDDGIVGKAHGLADLADGALGPVGDHGRRHAGPVAAVFLVDVLDHLLAPAVFEINVDIGRFAALGTDEPFEQEVDAARVDGGNAEAEAHRRVGRRAASLAENVAAFGKVDDIVDGQEIGREIKLRDQFELMGHLRLDLVGDTAGVTPVGTLPGQTNQFLLRGAALGDRFRRVFIAQLVEGKGAGIDDCRGIGNGLGKIGEQPRHLVGRLQMAFAIGEKAVAGVLQGATFADAGENVL